MPNADLYVRILACQIPAVSHRNFGLQDT